MKDFIGIVLLGVGGYLIYEWLFGTSTGTTTTTTTPSTPVPTTANTTQNTTTGSTTGNQGGSNNTPITNELLLQAMVLQAAQANSVMQQQAAANGGQYMGTVSQWNYLLDQVTGGNGSDDLVSYPQDTGAPVSINTYFSWRSAAGLSGLGRVYASGYHGLGAMGTIGAIRLPMIQNGNGNPQWYPEFSSPNPWGLRGGWGVRGLGAVGQGYGINALRLNSDATAYELAIKRFG